eukprot:CAMPEP_0185621222 /NCGR_PEP_ID=MMETSP0436-20130131/56578_1 /TAXON_ID=626734 ORGANISM="Favella taraikaensis, Strain Fe Narragansett Bay" /NCGR_SAMPLE_ID=MMETSP0436 /ASSEMBLY_ACC=CAM_ASM_000390 /LENGTH=98 /DNA_ID=CAMNT_0028262255 /DNA_START=183 /DNA_END=475 /DNA_ORIENTATION=-
MLYTSYDLFFAHEVSAFIFRSEIRAELAQTCPPSRVHMRVIWVPDDLIVGSIGHDPLILTILDLEGVNEVLLEVMGVLGYEVLWLFAEGRHALSVVRT